MYDLMLKYCPACGGEFRAEVMECGGCKISLVSGAEMAAREQDREALRQRRGGALSPADDLVAIHSGPLADLRRLEELLREERIVVLVAGDDASCGKGCCPSTFLLQVRREDSADAAAILEREYRRHTHLDSHHPLAEDAVFNPEAGEATCPACGHRFPTSSATCPDCGLCFG